MRFYPRTVVKLELENIVSKEQFFDKFRPNKLFKFGQIWHWPAGNILDCQLAPINYTFTETGRFSCHRFCDTI